MSTARRSPAASTAAPEIGFLPTLAIILAALGAALCAVVLYIHHQISGGQGGYTSFCDVSERLSCDVVLASSYASVLGIPVAGWALAAYLVTAALAFSLGKARSEARARVAATLAAFTAAMLAISVYFFFVSTFVIGVACPLCLTLDAVNLALFGVAFAIARMLHVSAPPGWSPARFWLPTAVAIVAAVIGLGVLQVPRDGGADALTVAEIRERDPRFYAWYISQPVVDLNLDEKDVAPPDWKQLQASLGMSSEQLVSAFARLARSGKVVLVADDVAFDADAYARARELLAEYLTSHPEITMAEYRTLLGSSRKYALALLEHFDREGLTIRIGDARRLAE